MGGGASNKCVDLEKTGITPKHTEPFFMQLSIECAEFPTAPLWASDPQAKARAGAENVALTVRPVFVKMYADNTPHACENFRRLCERESSGYKNTVIHSVKPGISYGCGRIKGKNASSFDGRPFENEGEEDLEHDAYTLSMVSAGDDKRCKHKLADGHFGSEFMIYGKSVESGSVKASMLDQGEGSFVIGKVVDGFLTFELLESLMASRKWMSLQAQAGNTGSIANFASSPGGEPPIPVTIKSATEVKWKKKRKHRSSKGNIFNPEVFGSPGGDKEARRVKAALAKKKAQKAAAANRFNSDQDTEESKESTQRPMGVDSSGHGSSSVVSSNKRTE